MANEANIRSSFSINKGSVHYSSLPSGFTATVTGSKGPTPGSITVSPYGTDVDLTQLENPSLCHIANQDDANIIEVGMWDPETDKYYPLIELLPAESYVLRLSRNIFREFGEGVGTGTGTVGPSTNTLRLRSNLSDCDAFVGAFER